MLWTWRRRENGVHRTELRKLTHSFRILLVSNPMIFLNDFLCFVDATAYG
jgi:hypothetical protein